jgi:transposase-like protein
MAQESFPRTLVDAIRYFADPQVCHDTVTALRWPNGVACPREGCGSNLVQYIATRRIWRCKACKRQFSVKVGTIFEDSPIGLDKWLAALWLLTSGKKGISSYQMSKSIGVTQKTAWFMDHRLRLAMRTESFMRPMSGEVEADETFVGGKRGNRHKDKQGPKQEGTKGKAIVMGLLERETGEFRAAVVPSTRKYHLQPMVRENVIPGSTLYTDAHGSYRGLASEYAHGFVDHAVGYVDGRISTNGVENFWSLLKRGLTGIYHSVEAEHLDRYLDEFSYRFNTRKLSDSERFTASVPRVSGKRLTYAALTGHS